MAVTSRDTKECQLRPCDLLEIFEGSSSKTVNHSGEWFAPIRDKLYTMFCSPMREEYTNEAFEWVSQLCLSLGDFSWIFVEKECSRDEVKMFSCIASLSLNEIHILLPLVQRHLTDGDEPDIEDGKVLARSANDDDYNKFGIHLIIVESLIKTLVKDQYSNEKDDTVNNKLIDAMRGEELVNLLDRLKEVILLISDYLKLVHQHWVRISDNQETEKFLSADGALRLVSVWLSEEPLSLENQCKEFLIDLMIKNLIVSTNSTKSDLLVLALHSIVTSSELLECVSNETENYKKSLEAYLKDVQSKQPKGVRNKRRGNKEFNLKASLVKDLLYMR